MNDRNKGTTSIDTLMKIGLSASTAIPVVLIAILGIFAHLIDPTAFVFLVGACAMIVLVAVLTINYFVRRRIQDRLLGLVDVCRSYAGGDRAVRATVIGDDEFAMLSMSLNTLLDSQGFISGGAPSISSSGGSEAAALQAQIEKLLQEVSAVGDGDLRVQAEVTPDTLGVLADSFNYMIEELAKVVGRVQSTALQVTHATRRILDRSAELAQASETQVAQISQTTEAVEALAVFIQNVARNAQLSAEAAQEALRNASTGEVAVRQTIDGMMLIRENVQETSKKIKRLGERSNEIGEIVRIIEDIADQTNLLALNAAIQSAMAGEHGRGFAVVADEIRLLAERSTESTKRIATLVKSIQGDTFEAVVAMEDSTQEVVKGSQLADEAGRALSSIYAAVERQAQMIESIARAANEQASVSENVAVAMGQISEITRQTNTGTQEAAVSVSYLSELADQLRASVATFRLPDRLNETVDIFPSMSGVPALPGANGDQFYAQDMTSGTDWNQAFSGDLLPLPQMQEQGNSGAMAALTAHAGQFTFNNQQDFGNQPTFGGQHFGGQLNFGAQQPFTSQPGNSGQRSLDNQQNFAAPQSFANQPGFGGQRSFDNQQNFAGQRPFDNQQNVGTQRSFGGQPTFNGQQPFDNQSPFGGQRPFGGQQPFDNQHNFGGQQQASGQPNFAEPRSFDNQPIFGGQQPFGNPPESGSGFAGRRQNQSLFPPGNQAPFAQQQTFGTPAPSQPGQPPASRQRWNAPQQNQNQPSSGQDQGPFPGNRQFGQ